MKTRCLLIDDEPLAIEILESYLSKFEDIEIAGKCSSALQAYELIKKQKIDLLFLDIQMPDLSGLDFLRMLNNPPKVIITTAHRKYALDGFDLDVVDYLLKPISFERFFKALNKYYSSKEDATKVFPGQISHGDKSFVYIKENKKILKIFLDDILFIESMKDYVVVHTPEKKILTRNTISELENKLPAEQFLRIHRSYIVAVAYITAITPSSIEIGKKELTIGRSYKNNVLKSLGYTELKN